MAASDATPVAIKNQAYRVVFPIWDADGDLVTGAAGLDSEVSKDQGAFTDCTNEATEIATSSGIYYLDLTATEMNADNVAIIVKTSTTGAKTTVLTLYPAEQNDIRVNVVAINSTAAATPGASGGILISGSNSGTTTLGALTVTGATTLTGNVSMAAGLTITQSSSNTSAVSITGNGTGHGISITSGSGATGDAILMTAASTNGNALRGLGSGSGDGFHAQAGATGRGLHLLGGATSGDGLYIETTSGDGVSINASGTSKHGVVITGGTGGTSDGLKCVAGTGGVPIRGDITGNITGNLSGSVNSVTTTVSADIVSINSSSTAADNAQYFWDGAAITGTAQAGGASTITLAAGANATDDFYNKAAITIVSGTGAGQTRQISDYVGATKVATVDAAWTTNPDNTSVYQIIGRIV